MRNVTAMRPATVSTAAFVGAIVLTLVAVALAPRPAQATPAVAKATGQPCTKCHTAPPALNDYGKKYKDSQKK